MRLSKTHHGQHSDQEAKRQARYRGYDILMQRRDLCWMVTMKPSRPGLPVFQMHPLKTATQSEREALALAGFEITHAEALRPFALIGALVIIGAAGLWLVDEFGGSLLRR